MKQTLLLMVLALGMICINVSAQTKKTVRKVAPKTSTTNKTMQKNSREYKIDDDDGFEFSDRLLKKAQYMTADTLKTKFNIID